LQLHTRTDGDGPPVVLLHGLLGSNENLGGIARGLGGEYGLIGMDLRNHGRSPHGTPMDYATMAGDVRTALQAEGIQQARFVGHSMGGKVAMELALGSPEWVERLVVLDIAPIAYERRHDATLEALHGLEPATLGSRQEADDRLAAAVPNAAVRQFLLKNLARNGDRYAWRIPLETIRAAYPDIAAAPPSPGPYDGPALFLRGADSDYVPADAAGAVRARFPQARIETLTGAGHWPHVEQPAACLAAIRSFLAE